MTPKDVLRLQFTIEDSLMFPPSVTGKHLEHVRELLGKGPKGSAVNVQEKRMLLLGDLVILTKELTPEELRVCRLRYATPAGLERYHRILRENEVQLTKLGDGSLEMLTPQAETLVRKATMPDGSRAEGYVEVEGKRVKMPTYHQIAQHLGVPTRRIRRWILSALQKIERAIEKVLQNLNQEELHHG